MKKQFFLFLILVLAAALLSGCGRQPAGPGTLPEAETAVPSGPADGAFALGEDLYITELFSYSGPFVEDGGDGTCEGIAALRLENRSSVHYEYLTVSVETDDGSYTFAASTLFAGASVTVLEKNKSAYTGGGIRAAKIGARAVFADPPTVHLDTLSVSFTDGFVTVKNLTGSAFSNVYVYYKSVDANGFFGGITYRAAVGDLAAGAVLQTPAPHIRKDGSRVVFVVYDS